MSFHILARIVGLASRAILHQLLELVVARRSGSTMRTVASRSPAPLLALRPLPLRRNVRPELVPAGIAKFDRAVERRHAHLAAEHRLIKRDRQIEPQVGAIRLEQRMRRDVDRDQRIARLAGCARPALTLQPDLLAARRCRPES